LEIGNEKILVVDHEFNVCKILETQLSICGYKIIIARDGKQALTLFRKEQPDLVVLDVLLTVIDGYTVCSKLREESTVPIIILTALGNISNRVLGLELGADDYVIKPFSPRELEARIRSVLRRTRYINSYQIFKNYDTVCIGNFKFDINKRQVFKNQRRVKLTGIEFSLLELFILKAGERLSRASILKNIWGYIPERYSDMRVVDVYISRLRSKLEEDPNNPDLILTVRGAGYMFQKFHI
jgi:OmpR family response regulator RpaB